MKLETQRDRWQAVLDGCEIQDSKGNRYKMGETGLIYLPAEHSEWFVSASSLYAHKNEVLTWQLYEPPKPENKVIVIKADPSFYFVDALDPGIGYVCENDAIRAAVAWIGEKASKVKITPPQWFVLEDETYCSRLGRWGAIELKSMELALLMRWPIEVLEEV